MGYLICEDCEGKYKLKNGETIDDFDKCSCGGKLKYIENFDDKNSSIQKCSNCGTYNKKDAVFCKKCGKDLNSESMIKEKKADRMVGEIVCSQCSQKNSSDSKYCNYCGFDLTKSAEKKSINKKKKSSESSNYHNTVISGYILSFLFVPVGLVIGMYLISQKSEYAKKHGWIIFGITFTISFLFIMLLLILIYSNLGSISNDIGDIYYRMGEMRLY